MAQDRQRSELQPQYAPIRVPLDVFYFELFEKVEDALEQSPYSSLEELFRFDVGRKTCVYSDTVLVGVGSYTMFLCKKMRK